MLKKGIVQVVSILSIALTRFKCKTEFQSASDVEGILDLHFKNAWISLRHQ